MSILTITHYEVRGIRSNQVACRGTSLTEAANMLDEGMCFGTGETKEAAHQQATAEVSGMEAADRFGLTIRPASGY